MAIGHTSAGILVSGSDYSFKLTGGNSGSLRSLLVTGSQDIELEASGSSAFDFPPSSSVLLGDVTEQTFSKKTGSFYQIDIPSRASAPSFAPVTQSTSTVTMIYDTSANELYIYSAGTWRSSSFV